jgi:hypothetical protein
MGTIYLMSTMVTPVDLDGGPRTVLLRKISVAEAREVLSDGYTSAVGHAGTADLLTRLLGTPVSANRITVRMSPGDRAVHFALKTRLPEGAVLSASELTALEYDLVLSEVPAPAPPAAPTADAGKPCLHCGGIRLVPMALWGLIVGRKGKSLVGRTVWKAETSACPHFSNQEVLW